MVVFLLFCVCVSRAGSAVALASPAMIGTQNRITHACRTGQFDVDAIGISVAPFDFGGRIGRDVALPPPEWIGDC